MIRCLQSVYNFLHITFTRKIMITEKEYLEAQMIIKLYESQQLKSGVIGADKVIPPPSPPPSRLLKEGDEPPKPKNYR